MRVQYPRNRHCSFPRRRILYTRLWREARGLSTTPTGTPWDNAVTRSQRLWLKIVSIPGPIQISSLAYNLTESLQPKLKELRIDLIDQINECDFDEDEPDSFNITAFKNVENQAEKCCDDCIDIFNNLGNRILQNTSDDQPNDGPKDDRQQLSSMRAASREGLPGQLSPPTTTPQYDRPVLTLDTPPVEPVKPRSVRNVAGGAQYDIVVSAASGAPLKSAPVPQAPYRGHKLLVISPISEYSTEETNLQRRQLGPPYPVSPIEQIARRPPSEVSPMNAEASLIGKEIVDSRLNENEHFLERRRRSRLLFQSEMRNSIASTEEDQAGQSFSNGSVLSSPNLGHSTTLGFLAEMPPIAQNGSSGLVDRTILNDRSGPWNEKLVSLGDRPLSSNERSKIGDAHSDGSPPPPGFSGQAMNSFDSRTSRTTANGYDTLMTRQRSQGQTSQNTRSSRTSSLLQDIRHQDQPKLDRKDSHASQASQESIFGLRNAAPLSPPLSEHQTSGDGKWGHLATSLQTPGFGEGVGQGLEVVDNIDRDNGLILANEDQVVVQSTPTASVKSLDHPMRHDSSFYKFGGFCDGAKALIRGETGFRIMKRPAVRRSHLFAVTVANCLRVNTVQQSQPAVSSAHTRWAGTTSKRTESLILTASMATVGSAFVRNSSPNATYEPILSMSPCTRASSVSKNTAQWKDTTQPSSSPSQNCFNTSLSTTSRSLTLPVYIYYTVSNRLMFWISTSISPNPTLNLAVTP